MRSRQQREEICRFGVWFAQNSLPGFGKVRAVETRTDFARYRFSMLGSSEVLSLDDVLLFILFAFVCHVAASTMKHL